VNGFLTSVTLLPEQRLGIVVLTNTDANGFYQSLKREIMDAYLGLPYRNYSSLQLEDFKKGWDEELAVIASLRDTIAAHPKTALPLDAYAGRYDHEAYGRLDISKDGNNLKIAFQHHPNLIGKLEPLGGNRFLLSFNDILFGVKPVRFNVSEGKVTTFLLQCADFVEFTTYDFVKR
jgi:hypothetical protein